MGKDDGMDSLLSSLGGIDASRFQRPPAMKAQRGESSPAKMGGAGEKTSVQGSYKAQVATVSPRPHPGLSQKDSNSRLDSLLGDTLISKSSRCGTPILLT